MGEDKENLKFFSVSEKLSLASQLEKPLCCFTFSFFLPSLLIGRSDKKVGALFLAVSIVSFLYIVTFSPTYGSSNPFKTETFLISLALAQHWHCAKPSSTVSTPVFAQFFNLFPFLFSFLCSLLSFLLCFHHFPLLFSSLLSSLITFPLLSSKSSIFRHSGVPITFLH